MKNSLTLLIGIVLVAVLLVYMFAFQVRYDEVAVLTTFDRAEAPVADETGEVRSESLKTEPGLYFKLPWPIQKVYKYPRKIQLLEDRLEELQTADRNAIIVRTYVTWRIEDPYTFFRAIGSVAEAEEQLEPLMRSLRGVIGSYNFSDLVNNNPERLKLREIEQAATEALRQQLASIDPGYGISIEQVGIQRIVLPEQTTTAVFDRMRTAREALAERTLAEGRAAAATMTEEAQAAQQIILDFAQRRAEAIRAEGDREAATYLADFNQNQDLAIFLRQIEALKQMLAHNTTFILNAKDLDVLQPFVTPPGQSTPAPATAQQSDSAASRQ